MGHRSTLRSRRAFCRRLRRLLAMPLVVALVPVWAAFVAAPAYAAPADITTVAGGIDVGPAAATTISQTPNGIGIVGSTLYTGDVFVHTIWKIDLTTGTESTAIGVPGVGGFSGDLGLATLSKINSPYGTVIAGANGSLIWGDYSNNRVRQVLADGQINTIAGTGTASSTGDGGAATSATINGPIAVARDSTGIVYVADY